MNKAQSKINKNFIQNEDKYMMHYENIKIVSSDLLSEFKNELDLDDLLQDCCIENNYDLAKKLIELGADVNCISEVYGETLLHKACEYNSYECARLLIDKGADVNAIEVVFGHNVLMEACTHNSYECARLLIDKGADVNMESFFDETALDMAKLHNNNKKLVDLLTQNGAHE